MKLSWNDTDTGATNRFQIERSEDGSTFYVHYLQSMPNWQDPDTLCFYDQGLVGGEEYWYRVAEVDGSGRVGERSDAVSVEISGGGGGPESVGTELQLITFGIDKAWPNPFNSECVVRFGLSKEVAEVSLTIFNVRGQRVRQYNAGSLPEGYHEIRWDGRNRSGQQVATGIYLVVLQADGQSDNKRITLIR